MTLSHKKIRFFSLKNEIFIDGMILDDDIKNNLNNLLNSYRGPNDHYITLVYNDKIFNSKRFYQLDENIEIPVDLEYLQVVKQYKKFLIIDRRFPSYFGEDKYLTLLHEYSLYQNCHEWYDKCMNYDYRTIVLETVKKYAMALADVTDDMKDDYEIVLAAIKQNGNALRYASENMQKNNTLILEASLNMPLPYYNNGSICLSNMFG